MAAGTGSRQRLSRTATAPKVVCHFKLFFAQTRLRMLAAHLGGHARLGGLRPAADELAAQVAHPHDDLLLNLVDRADRRDALHPG